MSHGELPFDDALKAAGRLALRSAVMFRLWIETAGAVGRTRNRDAINEHWEHLRFLEHGQLVACVLGAHNLLGGSKGALTLSRLIRRARGLGLDVDAADATVAQSAALTEKVGILRHNAFAHLTASRSYDDVFREAQITPNEIGQACAQALVAVNALLGARGLDQIRVNDGPERSYRAMLTILQRNETTEATT